jgi:hypothetical protein
MAGVLDHGIPELPTVDERAEAALDADQRRVARALRAAARVVSAAGLPADYRAIAYARVVELELEHALELAA